MYFLLPNKMKKGTTFISNIIYNNATKSKITLICVKQSKMITFTIHNSALDQVVL